MNIHVVLPGVSGNSADLLFKGIKELDAVIGPHLDKAISALEKAGWEHRGHRRMVKDDGLGGICLDAQKVEALVKARRAKRGALRMEALKASKDYVLFLMDYMFADDPVDIKQLVKLFAGDLADPAPEIVKKMQKFYGKWPSKRLPKHLRGEDTYGESDCFVPFSENY